MPKPTFSPTKFETYLRCPLQYRYIYIEKLAKYYGRARAGFSLGGSVHRALQALHEQGGAGAVPEAALLATFAQTWQRSGFASAEEERAHFEAGQTMLREFHASAVETAAETLLTEKMLRQDRGPYTLMGKVDRLDRLPDGSLEVVDYKSGRSTLTEAEVRESVGLMCYEQLARAAYPGVPVRVTLQALRINRKVSVLRTDAESAEAGTFLDELAARIMADTTFGPRPVEGCPNCDYRRICPVYRKERPAEARG